MEKCGKKFQSRRNLSQHVNKDHRIPEKLSSTCPQGSLGQDQSELDLIALLSCVAEEDLKIVTTDDPSSTELITVDASAITPIKNTENTTENETTKKRKRRPPKASILKRKKCQKIEVVASTINMQDLV